MPASARSCPATATEAAAATAAAAGPLRRRRGGAIPHAPKRFRVGDVACGKRTREQALREVELQVEVLTPVVSHLMLYMWYAVLVIAIGLQAVDFIAWDVVNICGGPANHLRSYDKWTSSCATAVQGENGLYNVRWGGGPYDVNFGSLFVRFSRVVISLRTPDDWDSSGADHLRDYPIQVQLPRVYTLSDEQRLEHVPISLTCPAHLPRCNNVHLDRETILSFTEDGRTSILLKDIPPEIARRANESSIGILYQKPSYAYGTVIWRYVFLVFSIIHLVRFIAYKEFTRTYYEQGWAMGLQIALICFLDPMSALNIMSRPTSTVLAFMEHHVPSWFIALTIGFMFSVVTASMPWTMTKSDPDAAAYSRMSLRRLKAFLCESRSIFDPPAWSKIVIFVFILIVIVLDIVSEVLYSAGDSVPMVWRNPLYYFIGALVCLGTIVCCILVIHLHRNLGRKSYLDSRPQQLACRVFIIVLMLAVIYFIYHFAIFFVRYLTIPGMIASQPMAQLPAIMVSTFFVNIMTLVYTTRKRSELVPLHPRNEQWKQVMWPDTWYYWLSRHGSSMYVFRSEMEENTFNQKQYEYRMRQLLAKNKQRRSRRQRAGGRREAESNAVEPTNAVVRDGDPTVDHARSQTFSFFLPSVMPVCPTVQSGSFPPPLSLVNTNGSFRLTPAMGGSSERFPGVSAPAAVTSVPSNREAHDFAFPHQHFTGVNAESAHARSRSCQVFRRPLSNSSTPLQPPLNEGTMRSIFGDTVMPHEWDLASDERSVFGNHESGRSFARVFSRARSALGSVIRSAERNFINRPLHVLEVAETAILESAMRRFGGKDHLPFFNVETAIDCFNQSWEAYGKANREEAQIEPRKGIFNKEKVRGTSKQANTSTVKEDREAVEQSAKTEGGDTMEAPEREMCETSLGGTGESSGNTLPEGSSASPPINVEQHGYKLLHAVKRKDVQVIITKMDVDHANHKGKLPRIVVAFRGTVSMSNAWKDVQVRRVDWEEMQENTDSASKSSCFCCNQNPSVHFGFLDVWNAHREHVHEAVWKELSADKSTVYRVFATGHSLGGALATLCAYSLRKMLLAKEYPLPTVTVYTFGQPPIGNRAFKSIYNKAISQHFRVVNESDTIALIRMYGFHVGVEVDIDRHGNYICQPTYIERMFRPTKGKGFSVENHLMVYYAVSLNAVAKKVKCTLTASRGESPVEGLSNTVSDPHQPQESQDTREPFHFV